MMQRTSILLFLFACLQATSAQDIVQFKISKPYCIFNFLEAASGNRQHSSSVTLQQYITRSTKDDTTFSTICMNFRNIRLHYNYKRDEFPENRRQYRSTYDLIVIALVHANTIADFQARAIGILPNNAHQKLISILKQAEVYYDTIIWREYAQKANEQLRALNEYAGRCSRIFDTLNHFYNSEWTRDIPFIVSLYPIPGVKGNTTATPHANSLCVGVLTDEEDHIGRIGVVLHEMCHVLYDEQRVSFQHRLEKCFDTNPSPYKNFAHHFFDEGLATALGNGWAYKSLSGSLDTTEWYNNEYINGYGKELYPLAHEYISVNRQLDSAFVGQAIRLFSAKFPGSLTDYGILLNNVTIYNDAETDTERNELMNKLNKYFQVSSSNFSSPVTHPYSISSMKESDNTQLIIIDRNHAQNQKALRKLFPQLLKLQFQSNAVYAFADNKKRVIILLNSVDKEHTETLIKQLKAARYLNETTVLQIIAR